MVILFYKNNMIRADTLDNNKNINNILERLVNYRRRWVDDIVVWGDIDKIDNLWKDDVNYYISPNFEEIKTKEKYLNSRKDLFDMKVNEPPRITIKFTDKPIIGFTDGRHRFSNLRDMGVKKMPILIKEDKFDLFKRFDLIVDI
jgi:hypothetical protein